MTMPSRDPDGLQCYSDHDHDIGKVGQCMICGSTEMGVVGHVLPSVTRLKDVDPLKAARIVMHTKSATLVDGVLLDYFTASAIVAVGDALATPEAVAKLRSLSLVRAADICFKLIAKANA